MKFMLDKNIEKWIYRHFKWWLYEVLYLAKDTETLKEQVVYKSLEDSQVWVRKQEEFLWNIKKDRIALPRFKYIWNETYKTY